MLIYSVQFFSFLGVLFSVRLDFNFYNILDENMEKCEWKHIEDENENHYQAECGGIWFFFEGAIKENQMNLCPFCGEPIHEFEPIA